MFDDFMLCFVSLLLVLTQYNLWVVKTQLESLKKTLEEMDS
jgi:transposase